MSTNEKREPASNIKLVLDKELLADDAPPHTLPAGRVLSRFGVDPKWGLSMDRATEILLKDGPNRLKPPQKPSRMKIFLAQVLNAMTIVLIAATAVSLATMDWISGGVIVLLVVINVYVGFSREFLPPLITIQFCLLTEASQRNGKRPTHSLLSHLLAVLLQLFSVKILPRKGKTGKVRSALSRMKVSLLVTLFLSRSETSFLPMQGYCLGTSATSSATKRCSLASPSPCLKTAGAIEDPTCPVGDRTNMVPSEFSLSSPRLT
jgi:hypothetical protein